MCLYSQIFHFFGKILGDTFIFAAINKTVAEKLVYLTTKEAQTLLRLSRRGYLIFVIS